MKSKKNMITKSKKKDKEIKGVYNFMNKKISNILIFFNIKLIKLKIEGFELKSIQLYTNFQGIKC